jgi:ATP-dependent RNA helicase SUPV3L1/SUV3
VAEIGADGHILVENHYVGRLDGFRFTPDASSDGIHGKAARHAAAKVLVGELASRAAALAAAPDEAITIKPNGRIVWAGSEVACLEQGETALKPRFSLYADEHLTASNRELATQRLDAKLASELRVKLAPLIALSEASDLSGLARGLAFRLSENLGVLRRDTASEELKALDQSARGQLRKYGVRFGAFNVYIPTLLKPASADLLLLLWALHSGRDHGLDADTLPPRPQQGLTSVDAGKEIPEAYWRTAGFHVAGCRAVRIDMLERLSDLIRARVAWRKVEGGEAAPSGATGDGGFHVVPELMSMVGCSGEEFASILKALGFRRERRKRTPEQSTAEAAAVAPEGEMAKTEVGEVAPPATEEFEEIWRPGKRKDARHAKRASDQPKREPRAQTGKRERHRPQVQPKRERPVPVEHSPFAALKELRQTLVARRQERS